MHHRGGKARHELFFNCIIIKNMEEGCPGEEFVECDVFIYMLNGFNQRSSQVFTQLSSVANSSSSSPISSSCFSNELQLVDSASRFFNGNLPERSMLRQFEVLKIVNKDYIFVLKAQDLVF